MGCVVYISGISVPTWSLKRHPSSNEKDPQWLAITMDSIWNYLKWSSFDRVSWVLLWIPSWAYFLFVQTEVVAVHLWGHITLQNSLLQGNLSLTPVPLTKSYGFTREALARFTSVPCRSVRSVAYVCGRRNIEETTTWKESYQDAISPLPIPTSYRRTRSVEHICFIAILLQIWCEFWRNHNLKRKQNVLLPLPLLNLFEMRTRNAGHIHFRAILLQIGVIDHVSSARLPHTYCFFGHIIFASSYILLQLYSA
jgi:hypothetical protein